MYKLAVVSVKLNLLEPTYKPETCFDNLLGQTYKKTKMVT